MEHIGLFFPHLAQVVLDQVRLDGHAMVIYARTTGAEAVCPVCFTVSARVHSRYVRRLSDTAIASRPAWLLRVRKFFCNNASCQRKTFSEPLEFADRYARRTCLADDGITSVALALGGRAGARLASRLGAGWSPGHVAAADSPRAGAGGGSAASAWG